ncbi:MAG: helix-turn-helix domain-containing protein [Chloroflexota bacterium]|nr:helix-turn-helix domain-containing protein [Chloroflexota bacterium]MDE3101028.1 helix-turn-helix domain-containing protein [Chloroflexota bacterium]
MSESLARLGARIRQARNEAGLSQAQLGQPHFTRAYVSALELGKIRPAMKSLEFLASKLGKPTAYFLEDEAEVRRRQEREMEITSAASLLHRATAAEALKRTVPLLEDATTPREIARLRLMMAKAHNFLSQGAEALSELTIAERAAMQLGDAELLRMVKHQSAIALRTVGESQRARSLLTELLSDVETDPRGDWLLRMKLLKDLGAVNWDIGEYEKAAAYYEAALGCAQDMGDVATMAGIYNGLAYTRRAMGDLEGATSYLQRALGAAQISNDMSAAAIIYNALAVLAAERGHTEAACRHVDRAIELARIAGPQSYVAHYMNTKAECAIKAGDLDEAQRLALDALGIAQRTHNLRAAAAAKVILARTDPDKRTRFLEEAAEIYQTQGARQELGDVLMQLSKIAAERGDTAAAQQYVERAYRATMAASGLMGR